jgi:hypothetical protein
MPMAMKQKGRKTYRSMKGKVVDLDLLIKRNELTPAVGNARVNARGDELGPGGKIIRKREEVMQDYYKGSAPVVHESAEVDAPVETKLTSAEVQKLAEFDEEPVPPKPQAQAQAQPKKASATTSKNTSSTPEWVEDEDGNFVKKGE